MIKPHSKNIYQSKTTKRIESWVENILLPHYERGEIDIVDFKPTQRRFTKKSEEVCYDNQDWFTGLICFRYGQNSVSPVSIKVYEERNSDKQETCV